MCLLSFHAIELKFKTLTKIEMIDNITFVCTSVFQLGKH